MPVTQAAKRKKAADMTDSPPKRVTRARAKNTDVDEEASRPKATKITTASVKAAAVKKKSTVQSKTVKRKTRADEEGAEVSEKALAEQEPTSEPLKAKGRPRKDVTGKKEEDQVSDVPRTRNRPTKAPAAEVPKAEAPKTRGRPKKAVETSASLPEVQDETKAPEPVKKTTCGHPATNAPKIPSVAPATRPAADAPKKKVKFQQESDKENIPIETERPKKLATKPTGLKAKPVRKPAAARATTRGKKAALPKAHESHEVEKDMPLSPKKINQVAKSDPIVSEDELAGEKTPARASSKSPARPINSPVKDPGSALKLSLDQDIAPSSPSRPKPSKPLESPARRPPPSPFKDALKTSPKKVYLGESIAQPLLLSSRTPLKSPLLQDSPRRGIVGSNMTQSTLLPSKSPYKISLLQESPKRLRIEDATTQHVLSPSKAPLKASLLQSPARRPIASPIKLTSAGSPLKSGVKAPAGRASRQTSPSKASSFSRQQVTCSPFRAAKPLEPSVNVHTPPDEERPVDPEEINLPELYPEPSDVDVDSEAGSPLLAPVTTFEEPVCFDDTIIDQNETAACSNGTSGSSQQAETPIKLKGPAFALDSAALRRVSIESGSEDELASPDKGYGVTPLRRHGISAQDFGTPAVIDCQGSDMSDDQLSFTPLAEQLSSWGASSPGKQSAAHRPRQTRGMFSLGGASTIVAPEQAITDSPTRSPAKSSFFEDEMIMRDGEEVENTSFECMDVGNEQDVAALQISQESQASEEYGDENVMPSDADILRAEQDHSLTCTPAKVFTPAKKIPQQPREIHTVSKVPLRASDEDSPVIKPRQRSRSLGGPLSVVSEHYQDRAEHLEVLNKFNDDSMTLGQPATPVLAATTIPQTPGSAIKLDFETPARTVRKGVVSDVLQGAVVFVDVHTSEGADASGIFIDLLTQMGARCIKQWSWNPRASVGSSLNDNTPHTSSPDTTKVGITHVVYKDGGKRTLEKVQSSNGVVLCVGVGWVLE